jgi:hypothetical protein
MRRAEEGAQDQLDALEAWNRAGRLPTQSGFSRPLPERIDARFGSDADQVTEVHAVRYRTEDGTTRWATRIVVNGAYAIRLHLAELQLPIGARLWIYGREGRPAAFDRRLATTAGDLWTPIAFGEGATLEVEIPAGAKGQFSIREIAELRAAASTPSCLEDATCISPSTFAIIQDAWRAVAELSFMSGGNSFLCTGTLLNDRAGDGIPYLLTAHHCLGTQAEVSSLDAFWDDRDSSCGAGPPSFPSLPQSYGGLLLSANASSDYAFVRLNSIPPNRWLLGWDPRPTSITQGVELFRLSHPAPGGSPYTQAFSTGYVDETSSFCNFEEVGNALRPQFIYSTKGVGAVYPGSSGSAAVVSAGYVVGQLLGTCPAVTDGCSGSYEATDGAFSSTYPAIAPWLEASGSTSTCTANANTLCLTNNRFAVSTTWQKSDGSSGQGTAIPLSDDTGAFWFFSSANYEMMVKVLSGCAIDSRYWVFAGGLTNVAVTMIVTDTQNNTTRIYANPQGAPFQPLQDTNGFATCP